MMCRKCGETWLVELRTVKGKFKGVKLCIRTEVCFCPKCGKEIKEPHYEEIKEKRFTAELWRHVGINTDQIKRMRHSLRLTQKEFGKLTGFSKNMITRIESGHHVPEAKTLAMFRLIKENPYENLSVLYRINFNDLTQKEKDKIDHLLKSLYKLKENIA